MKFTPEVPALRVEQLRHDYAGKTALALESLSLEAGEQGVLFGPSGCGKTTLLHAIAGLLRPSHGQIRVAGQALSDLSPRALDRFRGRHFGIVFQRPYLLPALTISENLPLAQRLARQAPDLKRCSELLSRLDISELAVRKPAALSQGQQQRVAIARALIHQPTILLADEPTSSLDDKNAAAAMSLLQEHARGAGSSLLVVTHDKRLRKHFDREFNLSAPA